MSTGLTLVKSMTYRGDATEEWSNTYWFTGSTPTSSAQWRALVDALVLAERQLYDPSHKIVRAYGYDTPEASAVYALDFAQAPETVQPGVLGAPADTHPQTAGDAAAWVRWRTSRLSRGKHIYLRKYFHGVQSNGPSSADYVWTTQKNAYDAFGLKMRNGTFLDARTLTAPGSTDTLTGHGVSTFVTTRTLKRRGKRPGS